MRDMLLSTIYVEDCVVTMQRWEDNVVDMTITSPPYDGLRKYHGFAFDVDAMASELLRVTKPGGVVVWVTADQTKNGSESLTSFKTAIKFVEHGWRLHDTQIYRKLNPPPNAGRRYQQCFEYMFVFSKGRPKTANILLRPRRNACNDRRTFRRKKFSRNAVGEFNTNDYHIRERVPRDNIFEYLVGGGNSTKDKLAFEHPAVFPEQLVADQIMTWSAEGDVVYDPMAGSGTAIKMAMLLKRRWVASEVSVKYARLAVKRIAPYREKEC